jgi:hypothetical protein
MKSTFVKSAVGAAAALVLVCGMSFGKTKNVNIMYPSEIGNHLTLAPGQYKMSVSTLAGTQRAAFFQNGKLVGTAPVNVVNEVKKNGQTMVFFGSPQGNVRPITQIDVSGWKDKLMFPKQSS